jgi:drug/metabolite transporter (DMT)-like permease
LFPIVSVELIPLVLKIGGFFLVLLISHIVFFPDFKGNEYAIILFIHYINQGIILIMTFFSGVFSALVSFFVLRHFHYPLEWLALVSIMIGVIMSVVYGITQFWIDTDVQMGDVTHSIEKSFTKLLMH